jgi:choline transport protein
MVGWLGVLGWQTAAATVSYLTGKQLQALIILWNPTYQPKAWQGTLLIWAVLAVCLLFNTFFSRKLPLIEGVIVVLHIAGFFAVIIPLWVMGDRSKTGDVFTLFQDNMGWGSVSLSTMVGLTGAASCFVGVEAGAHMSEEVRNAAHVVPRAMMWTWLGNGLMGWIMAITFCFCVGDTMSVLLTPLGAQQVQVFLNTTGSAAGATGLTCIMLVIGVFACVAVMATNSRQLFAFARDNGVPFSSTFSKVSQMRLGQGIFCRLTSAGLTDIRCASQLSICDHNIRVAAFVDQPRLERCLHAGHLSRRCCDVHILPNLHRICGIEENSGGAVASFQV